MDYYRLLNVPRTASSKEIKQAYLRLAKTLHPDVTGGDTEKAELFKRVSEAHSVLSDNAKRRQYDAERPMESFGPRPTSQGNVHPYAAGVNGAGFYMYGRRHYGIDEEVWLAHHYGPGAARRNGMPHRYYGMHIVEERIEKEQERIERMKKHYKLESSAGYFLRRDARMRKQAADEAEARKKEGKGDDAEELKDGCVIA
ncbi:hypothetical protein Poli38472_007471 [Pythium oligandrum]|uniref:J domain-containing protein n=1 Tax=Pythium oligandrum TaxID=41045 RepID=A0A8K1FNY3_PYTOL|nr:hypothetical protein Poli38472_007471 [Pythium oligandrum]|eukprot:TMW67799.1 hypothetical protein Poli38472_007471 [Pythium oligandrum]